MITQTKVSCIIAAYNEENLIGKVLSVVSTHPLVDEVIVVDDSSTDNTKTVIQTYANVKLISYSPNKGKTFAVMTGLLESKNDIVMLIDADLAKLRSKDITDLINPVISGNADISITTRKNSLWIYKILGIDFVSGERVFYKEIIPDIKILSSLPKYGLEVFLNSIIIRNKLRIKIVLWNTVIATRKSAKVGWWKGTLGEIRMIRQIIRTIGLSEIFSQIKNMMSLRIK